MKENSTKKEFLVPSDLSEVQRVSSEALSFLKPLALKETALFDIRLCLDEALINAMKYGHRFKKELKVRLFMEYDPEEIRILVEDQGEGFDPTKIKNCTEGENVLRGYGRGLHLIHQLMDEVRYNSKGNAVLMVKSLKKSLL